MNSPTFIAFRTAKHSFFRWENVVEISDKIIMLSDHFRVLFPGLNKLKSTISPPHYVSQPASAFPSTPSHFAQAQRRRSVSDLRPTYSTTMLYFYAKNIMKLLPAQAYIDCIFVQKEALLRRFDMM